MKRLGTILAAVLVFVIVTATAASAVWRSNIESVWSYNNGQFKQSTETVINFSDTSSGVEALIRYDNAPTAQGLFCDATATYFDYLRLYRNGNIVDNKNPDQWYSDDPDQCAYANNRPSLSTGFIEECPSSGIKTYQTEVRFKLRWPNGDEGSFHHLLTDTFSIYCS